MQIPSRTFIVIQFSECVAPLGGSVSSGSGQSSRVTRTTTVQPGGFCFLPSSRLPSEWCLICKIVYWISMNCGAPGRRNLLQSYDHPCHLLGGHLLAGIVQHCWLRWRNFETLLQNIEVRRFLYSWCHFFKFWGSTLVWMFFFFISNLKKFCLKTPF